MYGFVVFVGGVVCECAEVVFQKEGMDLVSVVLCVYSVIQKDGLNISKLELVTS
jgi:hypothetical protein